MNLYNPGSGVSHPQHGHRLMACLSTPSRTATLPTASRSRSNRWARASPSGYGVFRCGRLARGVSCLSVSRSQSSCLSSSSSTSAVARATFYRPPRARFLRLPNVPRSVVQEPSRRSMRAPTQGDEWQPHTLLGRHAVCVQAVPRTIGQRERNPCLSGSGGEYFGDDDPERLSRVHLRDGILTDRTSPILEFHAEQQCADLGSARARQDRHTARQRETMDYCSRRRMGSASIVVARSLATLSSGDRNR